MEFFWLLLVGLIAGWLAGGYLFRAPGFSRVVDFFWQHSGGDIWCHRADRDFAHDQTRLSTGLQEPNHV